jgi:zinc transporter ZupT
MLNAFWIFLVALAGGLCPLAIKWSDRKLHAALALSTGIFLGAVFLHLLPQLPGADLVVHGDHTHGHSHGPMGPWLLVLLGVMGVYLIENLVFHTHDSDDLHHHQTIGYAAWAGLGVHALTAGVAYSLAAQIDAAHAKALFIAIMAHKGFEAFSLTNVLQLAEMKKRRLAFLAVIFALVTPLGIVLGEQLTEMLGQTGQQSMMAVAAGTFLYVSLCELLTEVFHRREDAILKLVLLAAGIGLMVLAAILEQAAH